MSDIRPSGEGDGAARLLAAARARHAAVAADLAVPAGLRLTEWQRATVSSLFGALVGDVEDALRGALLELLPRGTPDTLRAALGSAAVPIALPLLEAGALLGDPQLLALLLRRAEEHRLAGGASEQLLLAALAGDEDVGVAAEAMGLLIAQNGRFDSFHEPLIGRSDLPADLRHKLVWTVAAALRRYMVARQGLDPATADAAAAGAAGALLPGYDEADGIEARAMRLAAVLALQRRADGAMASRAAEEGNLPLLLALLAAMSGLGFDAAWELFSDPAGTGCALLLRAVRIERSAAAAILLRTASGDAAAAARLDRFDTASEAEADRLLAPWRADPAYRAAIAELVS
jgi:hypothetical protein